MITIVSSTNRNDALSYQISLLYQQVLADLGAESEILNLNDLPADFAFSALYENSGKNDTRPAENTQIKKKKEKGGF